MGNDLNKKEYITRQFLKTHNKKFENYVLTRIWHGINSVDIKMVMQQYVILENKYALLDAYFPQLNLGIEVDESQHKIEENITKDKIREKDVIRTINCNIMRIDVTKDLDDIHNQCDEIIRHILNNYNAADIEPWDIETEYSHLKYIDKGFISTEDNAAFRTIVDALKCFGLDYKGVWSEGVNHPYYSDVLIWFPKLYSKGEWLNDINEKENIIYEQNVDKQKNEDSLKAWLSTRRTKRIVFAYSKDSLGFTLYRFKGLFELDQEATKSQERAVWRKISETVETFK